MNGTHRHTGTSNARRRAQGKPRQQGPHGPREASLRLHQQDTHGRARPRLDDRQAMNAQGARTHPFRNEPHNHNHIHAHVHTHAPPALPPPPTAHHLGRGKTAPAHDDPPDPQSNDSTLNPVPSQPPVATLPSRHPPRQPLPPTAASPAPHLQSMCRHGRPPYAASSCICFTDSGAVARHPPRCSGPASSQTI